MSKPPLRPIFLALALLLLNGCASLSEGQCEKGNWAHIGEKDGANGWPATRLADHYDACAKYGIRPDVALYQQGYQRGLVRYCVPPSGFSEGRNNATYFHQCPRETEAAFLAAWEAGSDVAVLDSEISNIDSRISNAKDKIDDKKTSDDKRDELRRRIRDLEYQRSGRDDDRDRLLERAARHGYIN